MNSLRVARAKVVAPLMLTALAVLVMFARDGACAPDSSRTPKPAEPQPAPQEPAGAKNAAKPPNKYDFKSLTEDEPVLVEAALGVDWIYTSINGAQGSALSGTKGPALRAAVGPTYGKLWLAFELSLASAIYTATGRAGEPTHRSFFTVANGLVAPRWAIAISGPFYISPLVLAGGGVVSALRLDGNDYASGFGFAAGGGLSLDYVTPREPDHNEDKTSAEELSRLAMQYEVYCQDPLDSTPDPSCEVFARRLVRALEGSKEKCQKPAIDVSASNGALNPRQVGDVEDYARCLANRASTHPTYAAISLGLRASVTVSETMSVWNIPVTLAIQF